MNVPITEADIFSITKGSSESVRFKQFEYLSEIVAAATFAPPGIEIQSFLKCRRHHERKPCSGQILVQLQEEPVQLNWWCSECENKGVIRNWKGTPGFVVYSKRHTISRKKCEIILTKEEYLLLDSINITEPHAEKVVSSAKTLEKGLSISGTANAFDTIMGYIAFEANHTVKKRRQLALNNLLIKLEKQLDHTLHQVL